MINDYIKSLVIFFPRNLVQDVMDIFFDTDNLSRIMKLTNITETFSYCVFKNDVKLAIFINFEYCKNS